MFGIKNDQKLLFGESNELHFVCSILSDNEFGFFVFFLAAKAKD